jgi:hypothetical protein
MTVAMTAHLLHARRNVVVLGGNSLRPSPVLGKRNRYRYELLLAFFFYLVGPIVRQFCNRVRETSRQLSVLLELVSELFTQTRMSASRTSESSRGSSTSIRERVAGPMLQCLPAHSLYDNRLCQIALVIGRASGLQAGACR